MSAKVTIAVEHDSEKKEGKKEREEKKDRKKIRKERKKEKERKKNSWLDEKYTNNNRSQKKKKYASNAQNSLTAFRATAA